MDFISQNAFGAYTHYVRAFMGSHGGGTGVRVASFVEWLGGETNVNVLVTTGTYARGLSAADRMYLRCSEDVVVDDEETIDLRGVFLENRQQFESLGLPGAMENESVSDRSETVDDKNEGSGVEQKGKNWKRNQKKMLAKKKKRSNVKEHEESLNWRSKQNAHAVGDQKLECSNVSKHEEKKTSLRLSLEEKWQVENELKVAKARRELDLLRSEDLDNVKRLRERKLQGANERVMVQIEKSHASLTRLGDVPGAQQGFCQTVVDGEVVESVPGLSGGESGGCSISPSSSISEREIRNMMKENEDLKKELEGYRRKDRLEADTSRMYNESVPVTLDENEQVPDEVIDMAGDKFEGPEYFIYGKIYEENGKKYRTMKFDRENYSRSGEERWY